MSSRKRRATIDTDYSVFDDDDDDSNTVMPSHGSNTRKLAPEVEDGVRVVAPEMAGFCCAFCTCPDGVKARETRVVKAGDGTPWHRCCCHGLAGKDIFSDWMSPIDKVIQGRLLEEEKRSKRIKLSAVELRQKIATAKRQNARHQTDQSLPDPAAVLGTSDLHRAHVNAFYERKQGSKNPAVVLDLFSGIGAGIVALKRLGVAMKKVIHVEHDRMATHVFQWNHDSSYNKSLEDDGIRYVYYRKFEELSGMNQHEMEEFLSQHGGAIDIVVGGPPCGDYSLVNANRQGVRGEQGQYLPAMGRFIQRICHAQPDHRLFYLAENVVISDLGDLIKMEEVFQTPGACVEAEWFSPCQRKRQFFFNFPLETIDFHSTAAKSSAASCLEDGWTLPSTYFESEGGTAAKANTFMACPTRIDDERMLKMRVKKEKKFYEGRFTVLERERMMGFPEGYTWGAVAKVFRNVTKAFKATGQGESWAKVTKRRYYVFASEPDAFRFAKKAGFPFFSVKMSPPKATTSRYYFTEDGYAKHLLGNSFSVPVIEHILRPLGSVFESREYKRYKYSFYWEIIVKEQEDPEPE